VKEDGKKKNRAIPRRLLALTDEREAKWKGVQKKTGRDYEGRISEKRAS